MADEFGKESTPAKVTGRAKPEMVTIGGKQIVPGGRWNNDLMADYILRYGKESWISIGRLARDGCGANTIPNKKRVRSRLSQLFIKFLDRGRFLAVAYDGDHNSATAVKVADVKSDEERLLVETKLEKMRKRNEVNLEQYEKTKMLLRKATEAPA
jgi:hypothetical protein